MAKRGVEEKNSSSKRRTSLSDLPDSLLCHILSFLSTEESVRSSVLAQRWRNIWLKVPAFNLDSTQFGEVLDFVKFVDTFLESEKELDLKRFRLVYHHDEELLLDEDFDEDDNFLDSWMDKLVERRVSHLDVELISEFNERLCMPMSLYSCNNLVKLNLYNLMLDIPESESAVSMPCVKSMHLNQVGYEGLVLQRLIPSYPVIEKLSIIRGPMELSDLTCVRSQSLKRFTLEVQREEHKVVDDHVVEIDAPKLEFLSLQDHSSETYIIHCIGSSAVVQIDVNFDLKPGSSLCSSERSMVHKFLRALSEVKDMEISYATLEVIHGFSKLEALPQFYNLTWLKASFNESLWELLPTFLGCCPNLHTLVLEYESLTEAEPMKLSYVPPCFVSSLKFVELLTPVTGTSSQILARCFLTNCSVLQELTLSKSFSNMIKQIKKIPKRSTRCKIVID
ncbi:unnamed protein product [Thlaspi arvense]|uniref:F-box domain-containing protein n=1 Tax=Thlaspi arvense TaxID=13288 RepID=A0AAU9TA08_THLAR|nr:unnamed protein product [Thlaspi arvense]